MSSVGKLFADYQKGKKENEQRLTLEEIEMAAVNFYHELLVNKRDAPVSTEDVKVQLRPRYIQALGRSLSRSTKISIS